MDSQSITEIRIELPVGTIAGKWWGPMNVRPILCLHGWADNANTFDELIPLLPQNISYLAIDFPGHGFSSKIGNGVFYSMSDFIYLIKVIKKHYNWDKVTIMGHSAGAITGIFFAGFFPEEVDMLINIDGIVLDVFKPRNFIEKKRELFDYLLVADERNHSNAEPPSHTYEKLIEMMQNTVHKSINVKAAKILLERGCRKSKKNPNQYFVTRDGRLRMYNNWIISKEMWTTLYQNIKVPICYIQSGKPFGYEEDFEFAMTVLKDKSNFFHHLVEGRHHVHLTHPERVSEIISNFINRFFVVKSKL